MVVADDSTNLIISSSNGGRFRLNTVSNSNVFGFNPASATGVADVAETQAGDTEVNSFSSGGIQQSQILPFTGIRNGGDDQTITVSANDAAPGVEHSVAIVLKNNAQERNAGTVDEAIAAINTALEQS